MKKEEQESFVFEDVSDELPQPGYYQSRVTSAHFRKSTNGNRMLQVIHSLEGVSPAHQLVADYFVLEGASPNGIFMGRRRLVQLYRACGFDPKQGDEISPAELLEAQLQVRVEHDEWEGQPRLRIVGYRHLWPTESDQRPSIRYEARPRHRAEEATECHKANPRS